MILSAFLARGLAAILEKTGLKGAQAQGLSNKAKLPRLHLNLKPPPPPKPALPKERTKPKKKGDESYSDEEKVSVFFFFEPLLSTIDADFLILLFLALVRD